MVGDKSVIHYYYYYIIIIIIIIIFHFWVNNKVVETCVVNLYSKCDPDDFQKVDVLSYSIRYAHTFCTYKTK
jgi:hypothetical protein